MNKRYRVELTTFVFDSAVEFSTVFKLPVGASDNLEYAFRIAYHICKKAFDYETNDGESLQHLKVLEGDKLIAMAKFMLRGEGPDTHYYLEWLQKPNQSTTQEWAEKIDEFKRRSASASASDFTIETNNHRITVIKDLLESTKLRPQKDLMKLIFKAEKHMGFESTKVQRLEDDLGL